MKIVKKEVDYMPLLLTIKELTKLFYKNKKMLPCDFRKAARALMSEDTKREMDLYSGNIIISESIFGVKILIDNNIPFGECKIFIDALEVL